MAYVKAKRAVSVPMSDGTHKFVNAGDSVNLDEVADHFKEDVGKKGSYSANLFDAGKGAEPKEVDRMTVDPRLLAENDAEALTRERAEYSVAERHGTQSFKVAPQQGHPGRTLPENGADVAANEKYAASTHDTSESGFDLISAGLEAGELPQAASDAPSETHDAEDGKPDPKKTEKDAAAHDDKASK